MFILEPKQSINTVELGILPDSVFHNYWRQAACSRSPQGVGGTQNLCDKEPPFRRHHVSKMKHEQSGKLFKSLQDSDSFNQLYQYAVELPEVSVLPRSKPQQGAAEGRTGAVGTRRRYGCDNLPCFTGHHYLRKT